MNMPQPLSMAAGFVPYSDGSGYQVDVRIDQEYDGGEWMLSITTGYRVRASEWPAIRAGIDRLLSIAPETTS